MFKFKSVILIGFIFLQGCDKLGICKDETFDFDRQSNNTNKIRLDGYYYGDLTGENPNNPVIHLFYQNGVSYNNFKSHNIEDIDNGSVELIVDDDIKSAWGVYLLSGNNIEIQNWTYNSGCKGAIIQKGSVINDTTIRITSWKNKNSDKVHNVNSLFHFQEYSPKPDSTNPFIE